MKKLLTFFFPLNRLSGKMKKVGDFTFFSFLCSHSTPALVRGYLRRLLSDPEEATSMFSTVCVFFSFALTADQPLVRAWEMKKVFFFIFALLSPSGPQQNEKVGAKNTFFHFFFHCSALTAVPRGMKKKGYEHCCICRH